MGSILIGTVTTGGQITIGSTSAGTAVALRAASAVTLQGSGTTCSIGNGVGATNCTSDARLKENVIPLSDNALANILALKPVNYSWNANSGHQSSDQHLGFLAQEMQAVFPDFVRTVYTDTEHGLGEVLGIDYANVVVPMVKAIQQIATISGLFRDNLSAWLGSATNGITAVFAGDITATNKLCVGTACVTQEQFLKMINASPSPAPEPPSTTAQPLPEPTPDPAPEPSPTPAPATGPVE